MIVVTDQTTRIQVTPKPMENIDDASYLTRTPSGVPWDNEISKSAGIPIIQIINMETGTIVVVRISTTVSQFLSLEKRPGLAKLYVIIERNGINDTKDKSITKVQRICIQSKGANKDKFSLFGPAGNGELSSHDEIN